jgi:hypothetical protein
MAVQVCNPRYEGGGGRKVFVQGCPRQSVRPYLKNKLKAKRLSMVQVVECLYSKHEALSSIPDIVNKRIR